ncbi:MAG: hypothetical protein P1U56_06970 [Saprospiraceae bacterium]|nr:hypothetical protein [Saprospiraceae bacterium]
MKNYFLLLILVVIYSCNPRVNTKLTDLRYSPLAIDEEIFLFSLDDIIPTKSKFIGSIKLGEGGLSVRCGYDDLIDKCIITARNAGANIIELKKVKAPNLFTSCYRIEADLYRNFSRNFLEGNEEIVEFEPNEKLLLSTLEGLRQGEFTFYNFDGYSVVTYEHADPFNEKTIKQLKNKFKISKSDPGKLSRRIKNSNLLYNSVKKVSDDIELSTEHFIIANDKGKTSYIGISTSIPRNEQMENTFLKLYTNLEIPYYHYASQEIDSIYFANRYIQLGPVCRWMDIRNVQCPHLGQMDWSEFSTEERAHQYIRQRIQITERKKEGEFIATEKVDVTFEGIETTAQKYTLKVKMPKFALGGSNILYIYYVVAKIEEKYVGAILSHYDNDNNSPGLPPLLSEVMALK